MKNLYLSNFQEVARMNAAFGNPAGDPANIDWQRVFKQCKSIGHEFVELLGALGVPVFRLEAITNAIDAAATVTPVDRDAVRDALCDVHVFAYGAHHLMGIDADRDMTSVVEGVMTRFMKDDADRIATVAKHAAKGVTDVYVEGHYPTMILKSGSDQPDAPKGKFLKSASYSEPVFYEPVPNTQYVHGAKVTELGDNPLGR